MSDDSALAAAPHYRAFISYSHADGRFAGWLHRRLESARLPDKARLTPIFFDRAELAAGPDLSAQVRDALAQSAALVVVASPAARASRWVGQEIALFRQLHPDRPILAALIEGEPDEAFPNALLRSGDAEVEPLAADFRKGKDGKRLGLLKIVAGLTAQPLDRLVQRDAQTRQRRVMAVTAGALLLSLILAAALVLAIRARAEAERQRGEAEGLVEFMLTDLRDRLKGAGSPTIMASVNERALVYYSRQQLDSLPDESLNRRARVLLAMGEDDERLGRFPDAVAKYKEARRITEAVLARHPADPYAIFAHAQSEYWVGEAAWQQADLKAVEPYWKAYLELAQRLAQIEPQSARSQMELGYSNGNLCELTARRGDRIETSLPYCQAATRHMALAQKIAPQDPSVALALANRIGWQAELLRKHGRFAEAIALRGQEAGVIDGLLALDPSNIQYRERRIWPDIGIGYALLESQQSVRALPILLDCLNRLNALQAKVPDHMGLTEQRLRTTLLAARAAKASNSPRYSALQAHGLLIIGELKRKKLPPAKMKRFDVLLNELS